MQLPPAPPAEAASTTQRPTCIPEDVQSRQDGLLETQVESLGKESGSNTTSPLPLGGKAARPLAFQGCYKPRLQVTKQGPHVSVSFARSQDRSHVPRCSAAVHTFLTQNRAQQELCMKSCNVGTQLPKSRPSPASSLQV